MTDEFRTQSIADFRAGYLAALEDVEKDARRMQPVGNWQSNVHPGHGRQRPARARTAKQMELGSQHLAILRITQHLRQVGMRRHA